MVNLDYANAYVEVLEILKCIPQEDYEKIPKETLALFKENMNNEYHFNYNPELTLTEQNTSKIAKTIIAILFRNYWATDEQRLKILKKEKDDFQKLEKVKSEKYNYENLFNNNVQQKEMIISEKKNILFRIIDKIKSFLNRK